MKHALLIMMACTMGVRSLAQVGGAGDVKKELETTNKDTVAWTYGGVFDLGINQGFLHNWAAGGEIASLTINGIVSAHADKLHHRSVWSNTLDMYYGEYYAYSNSFVPRKTDDRIDLTSKYGVRQGKSKDLYLTALFNFKSQFTKGYDYTLPNWQRTPISDLLSPGYFILAAGGEYRKGTDISIFLSPCAGRITTANSLYTSRVAEGAFGIDSGKTIKYQFGAYFSGRYLVAITKNISYKLQLDLYSNYLAKDKTDSAGRIIKRASPGNIDVLFDNLLTCKLSKYIALTLGATFIYQNDVPYSNTYIDVNGNAAKKNDPGSGLGWLQVKQVFTIGVEYKLDRIRG